MEYVRRSVPFGVEEERPGGALAHVGVDGPSDDGGEGFGRGLAAFAHDAQHPVASWCVRSVTSQPSTSAMRRALYTTRLTNAAERSPLASAAESSLSSSSAVRPIVEESSETLGQRTLATGECSRTSASLMP